MEFSNNFLTHLERIGYTGEIGVNDLQQVSQGVVKPILQFLMQIVKDNKTAAQIKGNLGLVTRVDNEKYQIGNSEEVEQLEKIAALNYLKIKKLSEALQVRKAKEQILSAHSRKMGKMMEKMEEFKKGLKIVENEEKNVSKDCEDISEKLIFLTNEQENYEIYSQDLNGIASTFANNLKTVEVLPVISEKLERLNRDVLETMKNFSPEEEFEYLGVSLGKENGMYKVEEINTNMVVERMKKEIYEKREKIWSEFEQTEGILEEVQRLKDKLRVLAGKQVFTSKKLQDLHSLTLNLAGKKAQLTVLKQVMNDLQVKLQEKESQRHLSKSLSDDIPDSKPLSVQITDTIALHSVVRREILKKKLQIEEFYKKFLQPLKFSLPNTLTPIYKSLQKELKAFLQLPNLHPFNIPQKHPSTESFNSLFTLTPCSPHIFHLSDLLNCEKFSDPELFIQKLKNFQIFSQRFFPLHQIPEFKFGSFSGPSSKKDLESIANDVKVSKESIKKLEKILDIWVKQPAQHLIPWRKDHIGLNISEALELWKSSALGE
jgi:hypothetical protein